MLRDSLSTGRLLVSYALEHVWLLADDLLLCPAEELPRSSEQCHWTVGWHRGPFALGNSHQWVCKWSTQRQETHRKHSANRCVAYYWIQLMCVPSLYFLFYLSFSLINLFIFSNLWSSVKEIFLATLYTEKKNPNPYPAEIPWVMKSNKYFLL